MSRLLAKNSAPTRAMLSNAVRRWKSSVHHLKQQQRQLLGSKGAAFKVCSVSGGDSSLPSPSSLNTSRLLTSPSSSVHFSSARPVHTGTKMSSKFVNIKNINSNLITMEYAVRGPLVIRAGEIEKEIAAGKKYPFNEVIRANIGDCHAMGQKPLTHIRQMLALAFDNTLFDSPDIPSDVKRRTELVLKGCQGESVGSYTDSCGLEVVRRQVAEYIKARDGYDSDFHNIVITAGASPGIKNILSLINSPVDGKPPSVMIPIPQYPLYSATLAEYGIGQIGYYLDEPTNWGLSIDELQRAVDEARKTSAPRALVVINPGNPTGQVLTLENIKEIIKFAYKEKLLVLADEVYQDNIYDKNSKFHSFKKTVMQMGAPYNELELVSFMSTSKGYLGECGIRGGYMELVNFDPNVQATLIKSITASLCPTTAGQVAVSALVNTPKPGDESYELFVKERDHVLKSLAERADLVYKTFNSFQGFSCNVVQGAMYAFPQIIIPPKAIEAAKKRNMEPDAFYAFELLESTGICIVPGSGFKQKPGTYHFRTTILPQTDKLKIMLDKFKKFHESFLQKYN